MLDDLLGRTELKEQITELEAEIESLESQLESTRRRHKDAVTEKQEAQRRANRLDDRIAQLEDQVERLDEGETTLAFRREETLAGAELDEVLSRLESVQTGPEGALSAYVPDGRDLSREIREAFGERAALVSRGAPCLVFGDDAGLVGVCLRAPIAPEPFVEWTDSFQFDREWLQPRGRYTLALVRSDLFAMGTYEGDQRTAFHGFDSALKSQHSKGGFSQARFERLRDEQIDDHLGRCREALEERQTDRLFVVGERSVLGEFMDIADATASVDATGEPERALRSAWEDFWRVQMRVL